jgi:hypothetical protein
MELHPRAKIARKIACSVRMDANCFGVNTGALRKYFG